MVGGFAGVRIEILKLGAFAIERQQGLTKTTKGTGQLLNEEVVRETRIDGQTFADYRPVPMFRLPF